MAQLLLEKQKIPINKNIPKLTNFTKRSLLSTHSQQLLTWAGEAMSLGLSKRSRKGGISEFDDDGIATRSGFAAATEASLDRKGSLGFSGGRGGDAAAAAFARKLLQLAGVLFEKREEWEEEGEEVERGI